MPKIVFDGTFQIVLIESWLPRPVCAPFCPNFRYEKQVVRIGRDRLADNVVGDVRTIIIARIDMIDAQRDGFA